MYPLQLQQRRFISYTSTENIVGLVFEVRWSACEQRCLSRFPLESNFSGICLRAPLLRFHWRSLVTIESEIFKFEE